MRGRALTVGLATLVVLTGFLTLPTELLTTSSSTPCPFEAPSRTPAGRTAAACLPAVPPQSMPAVASAAGTPTPPIRTTAPAPVSPADASSAAVVVPSPVPTAAVPHAGSATGPLGADSGRPFAPDSAWNTVLRVSPAVDPGSAAMIARVAPTNRATADLYEYGDPVFTADAGTPTAVVECTENWGRCDLEGRPVRIPTDAEPASGSDGSMVIVDLVAGTSCDMWQARKLAPGRWSVGWGTCAPLDGDGRGPSGGATGAGVNTLAGIVRTFEMRNLRIPHALSIATDNSCSDEFRYPATKTDGKSSRSDCIPEGARLQLDPSIDVNALPGITPGERAVARALQTYGAINRDNCGSNICVVFETATGKADPYRAAGFDGDYYTMPHIPWSRLRVLR
jgi:hypothetical protein